MDKVSGKLTVFFEASFWVGVFERVSSGKLSVCKVTFGAEPKDYEIYDFVLKNYYRLRFTPAVATDVKETGRNIILKRFFSKAVLHSLLSGNAGGIFDCVVRR